LNNIHWEVFSSALNSFQTEDQCRIILFINDKLPLCASKAHPHYGSKLCPSCQREHETPQHLLACTNATCEELFRNLKTSLTKRTQELHLHPCIITAWWLGPVSTQTGTEYPEICWKCHTNYMPLLNFRPVWGGNSYSRAESR